MKTINEHRITEILQSLLKGTIIINQSDIVLINNLSIMFLNGQYTNFDTINEILQISNILYNNTSREVLPLEDGVYDLVVAKYDALTNNGAPVGAPPIKVQIKEEDMGSDTVITSTDNKLDIVGFIDTSDMKYFNNLINNSRPDPLDYIIHDNNVVVNTDCECLVSIELTFSCATVIFDSNN